MHHLIVVDVNDFVRLVIDWVVSQEIKANKSLEYNLPPQQDNQPFFFNPHKAPPEPKLENDEFDDDITATQINQMSLDLALTEMFNFYARRYRDKHEDFEQQRDFLFYLTMRGFVAFVHDMEIPIDKPRVVEVFKKATRGQASLRLDDFKQSLEKLGAKSMTFKIEQVEKKLKESENALELLQKGKKLPYHLSQFEQTSQADMKSIISQLNQKIIRFRAKTVEEARKVLLIKHI